MDFFYEIQLATGGCAKQHTHRLAVVCTTFLSGFATSLIDYIGGGVQLQSHDHKDQPLQDNILG